MYIDQNGKQPDQQRKKQIEQDLRNKQYQPKYSLLRWFLGLPAPLVPCVFMVAAGPPVPLVFFLVTPRVSSPLASINGHWGVCCAFCDKALRNDCVWKYGFDICQIMQPQIGLCLLLALGPPPPPLKH